MAILYEVKDLKSAREFLSTCTEEVILTNFPGNTRYYGMLVIDHIFKTLKQEYHLVKDIELQVGDDIAAYFTALKLGYKKIDSYILLK